MTPPKPPRKKAAKKVVKKAAKKSSAHRKRAKPAAAGILHPHADDLRQAVHDVLAKAGVQGLSLKSIQFAAMPACPDGQHAENVCKRDADGNETCTWACVPN